MTDVPPPSANVNAAVSEFTAMVHHRFAAKVHHAGTA